MEFPVVDEAAGGGGEQRVLVFRGSGEVNVEGKTVKFHGGGSRVGELVVLGPHDVHENVHVRAEGQGRDADVGNRAGASEVQGTSRNSYIARGVTAGGVAQLQHPFRGSEPAIVRSCEDKGASSGFNQADRIGNRSGKGVQFIFLDQVQGIGIFRRRSGAFSFKGALAVQPGNVGGFVRIVDPQVAAFQEEVDGGVDQGVLMGQHQGPFFGGCVSGPVGRTDVHCSGEVCVFTGDE